ncbi:MAG: hypothetical protein JW863_17055 [Chitinispirillaceae bacterium]|nr:hypothetical protein [Chitinispirillaceae bacterium]
MKRQIKNFLLTATGVILFMHCSGGPVSHSGGDDFPNMIADAGSSITRNLVQEWENPAAVEVDPSAFVQPSLPSLDPPAGGLDKRAFLAKILAGDSSWYTFDALTGSISFFSRKDTLNAFRFDTLIFKVDGIDTLVVSFTGAVISKTLPLSIDRYRYTDYDGDSLLLAGDDTSQQVLVEFIHEGILDYRKIGRYVVDAGPNGDFKNESDNRIVFAEALVTTLGDTITVVTVHDADGDGFVIDNGSAADSCLADLVSITFAENSLSLIKRSETTARMVVFPDDSLRNYAIRYQVENSFSSRTVNWTVIRSDGDSTFNPGDTVTIYRITTGAIDSLEIDTMLISALLGEDAQDSLDDALLGIYIHLKYLIGRDREVVFEYNAETPVLPGMIPHNGTVYFRTGFVDDSWIKADATLYEDEIRAEVTISDDKRYEVIWDYEGKVLSLEQH